MRMFWHPALIPFMPDATVKRLFKYTCDMRQNWRVHGDTDTPYPVKAGAYEQLLSYWSIVACEMNHRGLEWNPVWSDIEYRGFHDPFRGIREDWLAMYFGMSNPYPGWHTEKRLCSQILWLRNHGKDTSKILKALRHNGFKGLENLF